jgi:hypothetical protein
MIRQARTGDTVLVKSKEMAGTGRTLILLWWLEGEGLKTTELNYIGPVGIVKRVPWLMN